MEIIEALRRDMPWMFTDQARAELFAQAKLHCWTQEEDAIVQRYYPNYFEIDRRLPNRSAQSCRHRARVLRLVDHWFHWTDDEIKILKKNFAKSSWPDLIEKLPRRSVRAMRAKACQLRLFRDKTKLRSFDHFILDQVYSRAVALNFSMRDLDEAAGTYAYFSQMHTRLYPLYVRMDAIQAVVRAMGGRIEIRWADE